MGRSVLEGAFSLLDKLMDEGELGLTQLAVRCEVPKTTVHRLMEQIALLGAVENVRERSERGRGARRTSDQRGPRERIGRVRSSIRPGF